MDNMGWKMDEVDGKFRASIVVRNKNRNFQIIGNIFGYCQKFVFLHTNETAMERMMQKYELIQHFRPMGLFKTSDIAAWFRESEPELKDSSINWRVYVLVKDGVLSRVSKGVFKIGENRSYHPVVDAKLKNWPRPSASSSRLLSFVFGIQL